MFGYKEELQYEISGLKDEIRELKDEIRELKLRLSDVMNSILLSKFEIYLINTLKFDINDIVIARQQRKEFAIEWSNKYCS
jgi:predicted RNase H-like nuclease (RuvC/YqgF family)